MSTLARVVSETIKKELKIRTKTNNNLKNGIDKYNDLKKRGLIQDDKYAIPRTDVIGYSRFGHIAN